MLISGRDLDLSHILIMGVLNITPDSFSDGGSFVQTDSALFQAEKMQSGGADIIDIGGESTRPGAIPVSAQEELDRVIPVIERLSRVVDLPISVDTWKPEVMRAAIEAGAGMINDVNALQAEGAIHTASELNVPVVLMHKQGTPQTMQTNPLYDNVVTEVIDFLSQRIQVCTELGISMKNIIVDPGFGFGKTLRHNYILLKHLDKLKIMGAPVLAGLSRKSMIYAELGLPVEQRLSASLSLALIAVSNGAKLLRVHDVKETREAIAMYEAVMNVEGSA